MSNAMGLTVPVAGSTAGPLYATEVSDDLDIVAGHRHTGEANSDGYQVPTAGLDINEDLSFQSNNAISLRSTRFQNQSLVLAGSGDVGCVYEKSGDLWYNNSAGTPIQITSGAAVIGTVGGYTTVQTSINLTIDAADETILVSCDTTSNPITITLPLANTVSEGRFYIIKDTDGYSANNNITLAPNGSNTIDLSTNDQIIQNNFGALCVVSDGSSNWLTLPYAGLTTPFLSGSSTITISSLTADALYIFGVATNSVILNLPSLSNVSYGVKVCVKDSGYAGQTAPAHTISIVPNGTDTIEGLNSTKTIITAYGEVTLVAASSGWFMI